MLRTKVFYTQLQKMRSLLVVMLLAAAATASYVNTDMVDAPDMLVTYEEIDDTTVADVPVTALAAHIDISVGTIGKSKLLAKSEHIRTAVAATRHVRDVTFRTKSLEVKITAIEVTHVGDAKGSTASIKAGGVGNTFVTIRLRSAVGRGYHYTIEIYGC